MQRYECGGKSSALSEQTGKKEVNKLSVNRTAIYQNNRNVNVRVIEQQRDLGTRSPVQET